MATCDDLERFLRHSLAEQSRRALRPHYPRGLHRLERHGVSRIPSPASTDPKDARAIELVSLWARQEFPKVVRRKTAHIEHELRDRTGIRCRG